MPARNPLSHRTQVLTLPTPKKDKFTYAAVCSCGYVSRENFNDPGEAQLDAANHRVMAGRMALVNPVK